MQKNKHYHRKKRQNYTVAEGKRLYDVFKHQIARAGKRTETLIYIKIFLSSRNLY